MPGTSISQLLDRTTRHLLTGLLALLTLSLAGVWLLAGVLHPQVRDTTGAIKAARLAREAMLERETSLRAWLLTDDPTFRQRADQVDVATPTRSMGVYVSRDPKLAPLFVDMLVAQQRWSEEWAAALPQRSQDVALATVVAEGSELFSGYEAAADALTDALVARRDRALALEWRALVVGGAINVVVVTLLIAGVARRRRQLRTTVVVPVERILEAIDELRSGRPLGAVTVDGPGELHAIGEGLQALSTAIEAWRSDARDRSAELAGQAARLRVILDMAQEVAGSLSLRYVARSACAAAAGLVEPERVRLWVRDEDREQLVLVQSDGRDDGDGAVGIDTVPLGEGAAGQAARDARVVLGSCGRAAAVPMVVGARVVGVLEVAGTGAPLENGPLDLLRVLASHAAAAIEAARLHQQAEELAVTDALTRLPNRRMLDADLATECARAARYGRPLALVMVDVDRFKQFNDTFGHQRGDEVLQALAGELTAALRASDTAYRYGGEELTMLLRETDLGAAAGVAERLRAMVETRFGAASGPVGGLTISLGVAALPTHGDTPGELIAAADRALYEAKAAGRNRVAVAGETAAV